jgi:uracil-DNA glycosylase family 4
MKIKKYEYKEILEWYIESGVENFYANCQVDRKNSNINELKAESFSENFENRVNIISNNENVNIQNSVSTDLNNVKSLPELEAIVKNFNGCDLKKAALNTVFADGNPKAQIMLIGEAPGANEDKFGIPFCGQSGKLLNNILLSVGCPREDVYITNTVFWRPPGNRRPTPKELEICRPFVEKHVALVKPKMIILVGSTAVEALLGSKVSMHNLRNEYYDYSNQYLEQPIKTAVIFHPSYLLRQLTKKKLMWQDILKIKLFLNSIKE